ncbi:glycosyltransferase family 2 protein [Algoriphagus limi]|uniref:Glycosyltransferase n=1 Tax=Algoriphagus limi TaxID=2975273 RepID=A0ABT2G1M8_9BACT|nr:glycosyltransferase [Algoriphagus limi]MCS5489183.1 glycosyltransferase [Algoriphagus limi]
MYRQLTVGIVIPVYNRWDLTFRCVSQILKFDNQLIDKVLLVDDCSPVSNPYEFDEIVKILRNQVNSGYVKTVNNGFKSIDTDIVILLDSDAYPTHPFVKQLIESYNAEEDLGFIGFKTVNEFGEDTGNFSYEPSLWELLLGQKMSSYLLKFKKKKNIIPYSCAVSIRKKCLDELGIYDEQFKFLDGDFDHCMRIHRSKWKLIYDPKIEIYHVGGESIGRNSKRVLMYYESRWLLLKKYNKLGIHIVSKYLIISRLLIEFIFLIIFGKLIIKDCAVLDDKKTGRIKLISFCLANY